MSEFVAYNSRWRISLIMIGAIGFVLLGFWLVGSFGDAPTSRRHSQPFLYFVGWLNIVFFSLCGLIAFKRLFDRSVQLQIGRSGIRYESWSDQIIPWTEIIDVSTWSHKGQNTIVLHLRSPKKFPGRGILGKFAWANAKLTGGDIPISMTPLDRSYSDAMIAIEQFTSPPGWSSPAPW